MTDASAPTLPISGADGSVSAIPDYRCWQELGAGAMLKAPFALTDDSGYVAPKPDIDI